MKRYVRLFEEFVNEAHINANGELEEFNMHNAPEGKQLEIPYDNSVLKETTDIVNYLSKMEQLTQLLDDIFDPNDPVKINDCVSIIKDFMIGNENMFIKVHNLSRTESDDMYDEYSIVDIRHIVDSFSSIGRKIFKIYKSY